MIGTFDWNSFYSQIMICNFDHMFHLALGHDWGDHCMSHYPYIEEALTLNPAIIISVVIY